MTIKTPWAAEKSGRGSWIKDADGQWVALSCGNTDEEADRHTDQILMAVNNMPRNWLRELIDHDKVVRVEVEARRDTTGWKTGSYEVIAHLTDPTSEGADNVASWAPTIQQAAEFVLTGLLRSWIILRASP